MATGLGLRIGTSESVAAIVTTDNDAEPTYIVRESVLHMTADGDTRLGDTAPAGTTHSVSNFLARVGDPNGITSENGERYRAEDLVATAMFCLINMASPQLSAPTEIFAAYPAQWTAEAVDALRDALDYLGLKSVHVMSEAETAVVAGEEPAHGAALSALAAASGGPATQPSPVVAAIDDPATEEMAIAPLSTATGTGPVVTALAYSALPQPPEPIPVVEPTAAEAAAARRRRRMPVLVAAGFAAVLAVGTGIGAVLLQNTSDTAVPVIQNAESSPTTTNAPIAPEQIAFPPASSVAPAPAPAPAIAPVVEAAPPPPVAPPPPPPPVEPPVTEPPVTEPPVTEPPVTVPPTTEPTPTQPPVTEQPNGRNRYGFPEFEIEPYLPDLLPQVERPR
ncbi:hypothetical protein [Antrihabitans spumae]|uniref:Uncharacterized protein n=1 Tax=Antrihabitans spumae TaxID=3373370 RepID=A0ABW7K4G7_9NOCA